jgi:hypothetical protein
LLLYNLTVNAFWFAGVIVQFFAWLIKWIWEEVIIAGAYFIFSILWHYLVKWPWKIILLAFTKIFSSLKLSNLWVGSLSVFASLVVMFLGRYLVEVFELPSILSSIFGILAVIPIGVGLSSIIQKLQHKDANEAKAGLTKFITHLSFITAALIIICLAVCALIYLGTFTSISPILSSLFAGGNLFGSFFIICCSIVIVFSLAALPSFSNEYKGETKDVLVAFFRYLIKNNWGKYIVSAPAMLIPAAIACAIPYIVTQGVSYTANMVSDAVFEYRLTQLQKIQDSIPAANYSDWLDTDKVSDDSLKGLLKKDYERSESAVGYNSITFTKEYLSNLYTAHSSEIGAAPIGAMIGLFSQFNKIENEQVKTSPMLIDKSNIDTSSLNQFGAEIIPGIKTQQKETTNEINNYKEELKAVCNDNYVRPTTNNNANQAQEGVATQQEQQQNNRELDACASQRKYWNDQISDANKKSTKLDNTLKRAETISAHLKDIYQLENSYNSNSGASAKVAYLLVSLWLCLLVGMAFGAIIPMFAQVNHSLFTSENDGQLFILSEISKSNSLNPNQPLLGIILFGGLLYFANISNIPEISNLKKILPNLEILNDQPEIIATDTIATADTTALEEADPMIADTTAAVPVYTTEEVSSQAEYTGNNFSYNTNLHKDNGAPNETYEVKVSYTVDENGYVTDVIALSENGYGMEEEIVAAIERTSRNWKPATKDGVSVRVRIENVFAFGQK